MSDLVQQVLLAVLDAPHVIEGDQIVLRTASDKAGNATGQLHDRIAAALRAASIPAPAHDHTTEYGKALNAIRRKAIAFGTRATDGYAEIQAIACDALNVALTKPPAPERSKEETAGVKVKPLAWKPFTSDEDVSFMFASAFGVRYEVFHKASDVAKIGIQVARMQHIDSLLSDDDDGEETTTIIGYGKDLGAAYAIAQADFDALVLSALETPPRPSLNASREINRALSASLDRIAADMHVPAQDLAFAADTMSRSIKSWLDWQEREHGPDLSDDAMFYSVPTWPTRGMFKNWRISLSALARQSSLLAFDQAFPLGLHFRIDHDGFEGSVIGHYVRLDGKRGVVGQQAGTNIVHVYGEKWLK